MTTNLSPAALTAALPSSDGRNTSGRPSKRACVECNRKKAKCDMKQPACTLCNKRNATCIYPTSRKKRTLPNKKISCHRSMQQDIKDNFDSLVQSVSASNQLDTSKRRAKTFSGGHIGSRHNSTTGSSLEQGGQVNLTRSTAWSDSLSGLISTHGSFSSPSADPVVPLDDDFQDNQSLVITDDQSPDSWLEPGFTASQRGDVGIASFANSGFFPIFDSSFRPQPQSPLHTNWLSASASVRRPDSEIAMFELEVPRSLVEELINLYFAKVHCFVPIFHKPQFMAKFTADPDFTLHDYRHDHHHDQTILEKFFLLQNMLALAARFSTSPYFEGVAPVDRGIQFAEKAKLLYRESLSTIQIPTLEYLQGCTLLAFYLYLSGPDSQGWLMIGTCSRLAYDLAIDKVDSTIHKSTNSETSLEWRKREELRRVWWAVWELDTFASAISCRSHTIDRTKAAVKLPVSDENWFSDTPVESVIIDPDPLHAWHSLRDSPNQDERAWFLLSNYLLLMSHDLAQQPTPHPEDIRNIEKAVACYVLLLPPQFHLDSDLDHLAFNSENHAKCNWIICTNFMIQGCRALIKFSSENASGSEDRKTPNNLLAPLAAPNSWNVGTKSYQAYAEQVFRIVQKWPPTYIPYSSPIIGGLVLGPAAIFFRVAMDRGRSDEGGMLQLGVDCEMLKLCLTHIAKFWKIGSVFLDIAKSISPV